MPKHKSKRHRNRKASIDHIEADLIEFILDMKKKGSHPIKNKIVMKKAEKLCSTFSSKGLNAKEMLIKSFMKNVKLKLPPPPRKASQKQSLKKLHPCLGIGCHCTPTCQRRFNWLLLFWSSLVLVSTIMSWRPVTRVINRHKILGSSGALDDKCNAFIMKVDDENSGNMWVKFLLEVLFKRARTRTERCARGHRLMMSIIVLPIFWWFCSLERVNWTGGIRDMVVGSWVGGSPTKNVCLSETKSR